MPAPRGDRICSLRPAVVDPAEVRWQQTLQALERLADAGFKLVLVTGRPAGWAECWARTLPVEGVIADNGGLFFLRGAHGRLRNVYAESPRVRGPHRERLVAEVTAVLAQVPGARLSGDSAYTEVDLAVDYNEEARLGPTLDAVTRYLADHESRFGTWEVIVSADGPTDGPREVAADFVLVLGGAVSLGAERLGPLDAAETSGKAVLAVPETAAELVEVSLRRA